MQLTVEVNLTLTVPIPDKEKKNDLYASFIFVKGLHKTFWGTTKKCENKELSWFFF